MRDFAIVFVHLIVTLARLATPGGLRSVVAECRALGATDEFGVQASEMRVDAHDLNATILRLMGMNHRQLTYFYQGRDMRLTDVNGDGEFSAKLLA